MNRLSFSLTRKWHFSSCFISRYVYIQASIQTNDSNAKAGTEFIFFSIQEGAPEPEVNWGICSHHCTEENYGTTMQEAKLSIIATKECQKLGKICMRFKLKSSPDHLQRPDFREHDVTLQSG